MCVCVSAYVSERETERGKGVEGEGYKGPRQGTLKGANRGK